jgi:Na+-transporting NADH:ubiquinone oxidoreductase subunit A
MKSIHLKKGFSLRIKGRPNLQLKPLAPPRHLALLPERIPFVKPRLLVKEGAVVAVGTPIFEDKRDARIRFLSPGGGRVEKIEFGPRRVIRQIVIALDEHEPFEKFDPVPAARLKAASRQVVVDGLLAGGLWPFLRALPYLDLADPDAVPPAVFVRLGDDEPFAPDPAVYLKNRETAFSVGMQVLGRLCDRVVIHLTGSADLASVLPDQTEIRHFTGSYPSGSPFVQLYRTRTGPELNRAWTIDGQDVILLGEFCQNGRYPTGRIMTVGGSLAASPGHIATRAGVPLRDLYGKDANGIPDARYVVGGLFTGFTGSADSFMGFYQNALNLIDDGDREEPFGFIRPGFRKPSFSRAFLSSLNKKPFPLDCGQHGEVRACVNCGTCAKICPVDILPQFTLKCLVTDEVEEALAHGLLDCAECGLCTYACPCKIELREIFREAKAQYYKETA